MNVLAAYEARINELQNNDRPNEIGLVELFMVALVIFYFLNEMCP